MAIIWSHRENGHLYQVRGAGASLRLYTDGVLHSQFNPRRVVTGSVWDLLWLPLFFRSSPAPDRVLLLGMGAGTAVRQLNTLFDSAQITAVEQDPLHVWVARQHFGVTKKMATVHVGDACEFVARYRGPGFDLIVDDLFTGGGGIPQRATRFSRKWLARLQRCLSPAGIVSVNFADWVELRASAVAQAVGTGQRFGSAFSLQCPAVDNVVAALLPEPVQIADLRSHLGATPALAQQLASGQLRYRARLLRPSAAR